MQTLEEDGDEARQGIQADALVRLQVPYRSFWCWLLLFVEGPG